MDTLSMRLVIIESPFRAKTPGEQLANLDYLAKCARECFSRGEAPFASHALYTLWLDDSDSNERQQGILAGLQWARHAEKTIVYVDRGISQGMMQGINDAYLAGREIEYRMLGEGKPLTYMQEVQGGAAKSSHNPLPAGA